MRRNTSLRAVFLPHGQAAGKRTPQEAARAVPQDAQADRADVAWQHAPPRTRSLVVTCTACGYHTTFNVDEWPDEVLMPSFGPHIACTKCGHLGASVRPDWTQLRGLPAETRRR
jgi:hypothetical protein